MGGSIAISNRWLGWKIHRHPDAEAHQIVTRLLASLLRLWILRQPPDCPVLPCAARFGRILVCVCAGWIAGVDCRERLLCFFVKQGVSVHGHRGRHRACGAGSGDLHRAGECALWRRELLAVVCQAQRCAAWTERAVRQFAPETRPVRESGGDQDFGPRTKRTCGARAVGADRQ